MSPPYLPQSTPSASNLPLLLTPPSAPLTPPSVLFKHLDPEITPVQPLLYQARLPCPQEERVVTQGDCEGKGLAPDSKIRHRSPVHKCCLCSGEPAVTLPSEVEAALSSRQAPGSRHKIFW